MRTRGPMGAWYHLLGRETDYRGTMQNLGAWSEPFLISVSERQNELSSETSLIQFYHLQWERIPPPSVLDLYICKINVWESSTISSANIFDNGPVVIYLCNDQFNTGG
jgi:hypothetical protein